MRIIGGKYRGRHLHIGKGFKSRPTTDFAKENLFNILSNYFNFSEINVLDLFAGTGSISFEFVSRGCLCVDLVEIERNSCNEIRNNIKLLEIREIHVFQSDSFSFISHTGNKYDLIFADPPYTHDKIEHLPELVYKNQLLKPHGWFILEHSSSHDFSDNPHFREIRKYGSVNFSIFENKD